MSELTMIERLVLQKLFRRERIHNHGIRLETLLRCGFKPHERGEVKMAVKSLVKRGFIRQVKKKVFSLSKDGVNEIKTHV